MRNNLHIVLLFFIISGCRAQGSAGKTTSECDLLVSFSSKGSGTNHAAAGSLKKYLAEYGKSNKRPSIDTIHWGREGETDYCIHLAETSGKDQFVSGLKKLLKDEPQVGVEENKTSPHKR